MVTEPGPRALPTLTSLRFFAAALVVCYHFSRSIGEMPLLTPLTWYGRSGVTFFFILSGFVLAWSYADSMPAWRVFWRRRFARIWPLLALCSVLSALTYAVMDVDISLKAWAAELLMIHAWFPDSTLHKGVNPAAWSLSDEAFFYFLFPFVLLLLGRKSPRVWASVAAGCIVLNVSAWVVLAPHIDFAQRAWFFDYLPALRLGQFVVGVCLALLLRHGYRVPGNLPVALAVLVGSHLLLWFWHLQVPDSSAYGPYSASQILTTPAFAWVIYLAAWRDVTGRVWLGSRWLQRAGEWSFAWYLTHEIILRVVRTSWPGLATPEPSLANVGVFVALASLTLAVAGALYTYFERPAEKRLRGPGATSPRLASTSSSR